MLGLGKSEEKRRVDMMPRRRIELHAHTKMSAQDGVMDVADYQHRWNSSTARLP